MLIKSAKVVLSNIEWFPNDDDEIPEGLPTEVVINVTENDEIDDEETDFFSGLDEYLNEEYGWIPESYKIAWQDVVYV